MGLQIATYAGNAQAAATSSLGFASGTTSVASGGMLSRCLLDGIITHVRASFILGSPLPSVTARLWRDSSQSSLDASVFVASSLLYSGALLNNSWTRLLSPIPCLMGDAIGIAYNGATIKLVTNSGLTGKLLLYENADKSTSGAWGSNSTSLQPVLQCAGLRAEVVTFGDSITVGRSNDATHFQGSLEPDFWAVAGRDATYSPGSLLKTRLGLTSAINLGSGGQTALWGAQTFADRVGAYAGLGAIVVVNFGINDIVVAGMDLTTHQGYWSEMLTQANVLGVRLVRQSILHVASAYTAGGHDAAYWNAIVDTWNASMLLWCATNGITNVNVDVVGGQTLAAAGQISGDYIHPAGAGYASIATNLAAGITAAYSTAIMTPAQIQTSITNALAAGVNVTQIDGETANAAAPVTFPATIGTSTLTQTQVSGYAGPILTDNSTGLVSANLIQISGSPVSTVDLTPASIVVDGSNHVITSDTANITAIKLKTDLLATDDMFPALIPSKWIGTVAGKISLTNGVVAASGNWSTFDPSVSNVTVGGYALNQGPLYLLTGGTNTLAVDSGHAITFNNTSIATVSNPVTVGGYSAGQDPLTLLTGAANQLVVDSQGRTVFSNTSIATVTTLTNLPAATQDWLSAAAVSAEAVLKIVPSPLIVQVAAATGWGGSPLPTTFSFSSTEAGYLADLWGVRPAHTPLVNSQGQISALPTPVVLNLDEQSVEIGS